MFWVYIFSNIHDKRNQTSFNDWEDFIEVWKWRNIVRIRMYRQKPTTLQFSGLRFTGT